MKQIALQCPRPGSQMLCGRREMLLCIQGTGPGLSVDSPFPSTVYATCLTTETILGGPSFKFPLSEVKQVLIWRMSLLFPCGTTSLLDCPAYKHLLGSLHPCSEEDPAKAAVFYTTFNLFWWSPVSTDSVYNACFHDQSCFKPCFLSLCFQMFVP